MLKSYEVHRQILLIMWETEQKITKLKDPYEKEISAYKSYLKILMECIGILYNNITDNIDPIVYLPKSEEIKNIQKELNKINKQENKKQEKNSYKKNKQ